MSARRVVAVAALVALLAAAGGLIAVELSRGASEFGEVTLEDPCSPREPFPGQGFDATVQRIGLSALDGAACSLGAKREEMLLSLVPEVAPKEIRWDRATVASAVRAGLGRAIDDAEDRGELEGFTLRLVRGVAQRAPIEFLVDGGDRLRKLLAGEPDPLDREILADAIREALLGAAADARDRGSLGTITYPLVRETLERVPTQALVDIGLRTAQILRAAPDPTDRETITEAVRTAIVETIQRADDEGDLPGPVAFVLRELIERIPVEPLVRGIQRIF